MKKTTLMGLIAGIFAVVAMVATSSLSAAYADKGGDPNNSDQAEDNAVKRHDNFLLRADDDNLNNDFGQLNAHDQTHDGHGVELGP